MRTFNSLLATVEVFFDLNNGWVRTEALQAVLKFALFDYCHTVEGSVSYNERDTRRLFTIRDVTAGFPAGCSLTCNVLPPYLISRSGRRHVRRCQQYQPRHKDLDNPSGEPPRWRFRRIQDAARPIARDELP